MGSPLRDMPFSSIKKLPPSEESLLIEKEPLHEKSFSEVKLSPQKSFSKQESSLKEMVTSFEEPPSPQRQFPLQKELSPQKELPLQKELSPQRQPSPPKQPSPQRQPSPPKQPSPQRLPSPISNAPSSSVSALFGDAAKPSLHSSPERQRNPAVEESILIEPTTTQNRGEDAATEFGTIFLYDKIVEDASIHNASLVSAYKCDCQLVGHNRRVELRSLYEEHPSIQGGGS